MPRLMFPGPRARKVLRDTLGNKPRALLVILSIAVGVFASGAIASARVILSRDLQAQYATSRDVSATISASNLTEDFVESIRQMPGVESAQGRTVVLLRARLKTPTGERRSNLILHALPDFNDQQVSIVDRLSGPLEPPRRELLLERASFALFGLSAPGEFITLELSDGTTRQIQVAGAVHDINAPPPRFANFGSGYVTYDTLAWLGFSRAYNQVRVRVSEEQTNRAHIQAIADQIKKRIEDSGRVFFSTGIALNPGRHYADEQIQSMSLILAVIGGLSLVLSGFLVINTVTAVMQQHVRQIGIMKTIGGRARQLTVMYLSMVAALGALSLTVSIPLGSTGARALTEFIASLLNFDILTTSTPPDVLALEVIIGLAVPTLAALVPISAGVRLSVREALSYTGMAEATPHPDDARKPRHNPLQRRLARLPRPFLLSLRNTFRRKGRLILTLGTLALSSATFVAVFSVRGSLDLALAQTLRYWDFDIEVTLANAQPDDRLINEARTVPGVVDAQAWALGGARRVREDGSESRFIAFDALPADSSYMRPVLIEGRWIMPEDTNAIVVNTDVLADEPDIKVGDAVRFRFGPRLIPFEVVGITQGTLTGQVRNARRAYANLAGYRDAIGTGRLARTLVVRTDAHDGASQARIAKALEEQFKRRNLRVDTYETISDRRDQIDFQFSLLVIFLMIMAALLAVVGALGLAGTMSMNVLERTREIGVMRAIGAGSPAIRGIVVGEGAVIGWLAWLIGGLLAAPVSAGLSHAVGLAFLRQPLPFVYSWSGLLLWFGAITLLSAAASFAPAWRASRLTVREVLAYE